jgi:hypothetical protein
MLNKRDFKEKIIFLDLDCALTMKRLRHLNNVQSRARSSCAHAYRENKCAEINKEFQQRAIDREFFWKDMKTWEDKIDFRLDYS